MRYVNHSSKYVVFTSFKYGCARNADWKFERFLISSVYMLYRAQAFRYFSFSAVSTVRLKELLVYSLPLVPNALSWWIMSAFR